MARAGEIVDQRRVVDAILKDTAEGMVGWDQRTQPGHMGEELFTAWRGLPVVCRTLQVRGEGYQHLFVNGLCMSDGGITDKKAKDDEAKLREARHAGIMARLKAAKKP